MDGRLRFFVRTNSPDQANEYMVLTSSGRLGIGTTNPSNMLEVVGTGTFQGIRIVSGASNGFVLTSDASGNARWAAAAG